MELQARHTYHLSSAAGGRVLCTAWTNDDEDKGYPTEEARWDLEFKSLAAALSHTGGTRTGCNGCSVEVSLDGVLIDEHGKRIERR